MKEFKLYCNHCETDIVVSDDDINIEIDQNGQLDLSIDCNNCFELAGYYYIKPSDICLDGQ